MMACKFLMARGNLAENYGNKADFQSRFSECIWHAHELNHGLMGFASALNPLCKLPFGAMGEL